MTKHVHIVTHEIPWPTDFGGVIDLFYKITALHQQGVKIHLHCFFKTRMPQSVLSLYCETVHYYPRKKHLSLFHFNIPFIVQSRRDDALLENLNKDNHPIILEGVHCTYLLQHQKLSNRKVMVRLHNIESNYYFNLYRNEKNIFKKLYYRLESLLLKKYERKIAASRSTFCTVSKQDQNYFQTQLHNASTFFLPVFIPWRLVKSESGKGLYCLYHGNLSVNENEEAVIWLIKNVFCDNGIPFVVAGKSPSDRLKKLIHHYSNTCIIENPSDFEIEDLIKKAQINILPSFNNTGIKLKILHALYNGRHCICNNNAVAGSELESLCIITNDVSSTKEAIKIHFDMPFSENEIQKRKTKLQELYNNSQNAEQLIRYLQ